MRYCAIALTLLIPCVAGADDPPGGEVLEQESAIIGDISFDKSNVFDLSNPEENNWLYRLANRLHIVTRDKVIRKQLLFRSGDRYSRRTIDESERILRQNRYLYDAEVVPVLYEDGKVDLSVKTRDVWTLGPDFSLSRSGGENRTKYGVEEINFLGLGQTLRIAYVEDVNRNSNSFEFIDQHLGRSWVATQLKISDNSDGELRYLSAIRPFFALDTRWSTGATAFRNDRRSTLYALGDEAAEFQHEQEYQSAFGGWSSGLSGKWVRRWTAGIVHDSNRFSAVSLPTLPAAIPADRKLVYPFIGLEVVEDDFATTKNRDQIGRTEDFYLGYQFSGAIGWSTKRLGADRSALIFSGRARRGFGALEDHELLVSASVDGRVESGNAVNSILALDARYYRKQSEKRLFYLAMSATAGHSLDIDNPVEIGGDTGLRGYPLRYQSGDSKLLVTIEQRYFTDWYPFRLVRIGGAVFADAGRVWGKDPIGGRRYSWLSDVGFGLRLAPTRSSGNKIVHLDVAFPLGGDSSIDSVQFLLESKRSF